MYIFIGAFVAIIVFSTLINYVLLEGKHLVQTNGVLSDEQQTTSCKLVDSFYFTAASWSTTGCPDIIPATLTGKLTVSIQYFAVLAIAIGFLRVSTY